MKTTHISQLLARDYAIMLEVKDFSKLGNGDNNTKVFEEIQEQVFDFLCRNQVPEQLEKEMKLRKKIAEYKEMYYLHNNRSVGHLLKIKEKELEELRTNSGNIGVMESIRNIERILDTNFDKNKYTVQDWLFDIEAIQKKDMK